MKKLMLLLLAAFMLPVALRAQTIVFGYDASGNRISRSAVRDSQQSSGGSQKSNDSTDGLPLSVFVGPNPTSGLLAVRLSRWDDTDECNLQLTSLSGVVLIEQTMTSSETALDLSSFSNGLYLLLVDLNREKETYKIIKK